MTRRDPLPKRFPGKTVARAKIWFGDSYSIGIEGPVPLALARLFVAGVTCGPSPEFLARLDKLSDELQSKPAPSRKKKVRQ